MKYPKPEFWEVFKRTFGAISCCEAIAIYNLAMEAPEGTFLDLGSNHGKAAMAAAIGIKRESLEVLVMVDPIYSKKGAANAEWGYCKEEGFKEKVRDIIISTSRLCPTLLGMTSTEAIPVFEKYAYVFIDTDQHQKELVDAELELLVPHMVKGGVIVFHDFGNQFIAPKEAAEKLVQSGNFEWVDIDWNSIIAHVKENNLEEGNNSWHMPGYAFPCFVGAVKRK